MKAKFEIGDRVKWINEQTYGEPGSGVIVGASEGKTHYLVKLDSNLSYGNPYVNYAYDYPEVSKFEKDCRYWSILVRHLELSEILYEILYEIY